MAASDSDPEAETLGLFTDPPDYYPPPPPPTTLTHPLRSGRILTLRLVGHNPLWGHHLWNAGRRIATYLEEHPALVAHRTVLELGAGAGLPGLVSGLLGAAKVVLTDYPDPDLVENLRINVEACFGRRRGEREGEREKGKEKENGDGERERLSGNRSGNGNEHERGERERLSAEQRVVAEGYCWGADPQPLLAHLPAPPSPSPPGFDVLILADLLFNHSEHGKLVATIRQTLARKPDARALVFFTPYRPWLYEKDMAFFELAQAAGFTVEKIVDEKMETAMFEDDPGDEELRRTVFGFVVMWAGGEMG